MNPLLAYHNFLRASAPSGYPNATMQSPHINEMSMYASQNTMPFRYQVGHIMQQPRPMMRRPRPRWMTGIKGM